MGLFENIWFVAIGGGIISGLILYFVTNWFFSRKDNSERIKVAHQANEEIVNILKPYIADKGLPEIEVVNALIASVARKFKLEVSELYSIDHVCEELIREIISNVYVSCDKKVEYTQQLAEYSLRIKQNKETSESDKLKSEIYQRNSSQVIYRNKLSSRYTILFSMYSSIVMISSIILFGFINEKGSQSSFLDIFGSEYQLINFFVSMILVSVTFVLVMLLIVEIKNGNRTQKMRNKLMHGLAMFDSEDKDEQNEKLK